MQGIWREGIGGWNDKDSKRKRQTRKSTLKDKARALLKLHNREDKNIEVVRKEPLLVKTNLYDNGQWCEFKSVLYLVKVRHRRDYRWYKEGYNEYEEKQLRVYYDNLSVYGDHPIVYNTGQNIVEYLGLSEFYSKKEKNDWCSAYAVWREYGVEVEIIKELDYLTWDISDKNRFKIETKVEPDEIHKLFVYKKPILRRHIYERRVSQKYSKQCTNRMKRRVAKHHIKKGEYDKCLGERPYYGYFEDYEY